MNGFRGLLKMKHLLAIGAGVSGVIGIAHCAQSGGHVWSASTPTNIPDDFPRWDYNWDKREPYALLNPKKVKRAIKEGGEEDDMASQLEQKKSRATRHIILIRHGQYNLNGEGDEERTLTPLGHEQAKATGRRLKTLGITFDRFISSNMTRAIETSNDILLEMGQKDLIISDCDPMLREGAPALAEPPVPTWHPEMHYYKDGARIEAAFRKYFHRADSKQEKESFEIIVCHANVIRYFVCRALQFPGEAWLRISLYHSSMTCLSILPSGRVILRALGDSGHLEPKMLTTS